MMWVENPTTATTHARTGMQRWDGSMSQEFETWCGRWIAGAHGESIASFIDCKPCKKAMRREGWTV